MINRKEFRKIFNQLKSGLGDSNSPLWEPERHCRPSRWFVKIRPINFDETTSQKFWKWCYKNCRGQVLCYSTNSDNQEEWWGFTHRADIVFWVLRWS